MSSALRTSEAGLKLIMAYEGFRSHSTRLPDGRWVIGYGHMRAARAGLKVSQPEAAAILREFDLPPIEQALQELVLVPLNQHEFDALVSFVFNVGVDQFESSDVLSALNAGDRMAAARALELWCNAKVGPRNMIVDPLIRRRADEKALFLKTTGSVPLAASSRFRPTPEPRPEPEPSRREGFKVSEAAAPEAEEQRAETPTEAAARNVKERLTRILGEYEGTSTKAGTEEEDTAEAAVKAAAEQEASVEEIRAAISALVAEDDDQDDGAGLDAQDIAADLDPDAFDIETGQLDVVETSAGARRNRLYIDDVKPAEIPPADPDLRRGDDAGNLTEMVVFAVIAMVGALIFLLGGAFGLGWFGTSLPGHANAYGYLPPFLMMTGALIFVVMIYYWIRAIISRR